MSLHYTKAPWYRGVMLSPQAPAIIGDGDTVVAILPGDWNGCSFIADDARLISAAPELLDALEDLIGQVEQAHEALGVTRSPSMQEALALAAAAIAKARGDA